MSKRVVVACVRCGILRRWCLRCHRRHCQCLDQECPHAKPDPTADFVTVQHRPWLDKLVTTRASRGVHQYGNTKMRLRRAMAQVGRRKGAQTIHREGKAHKWTSETARKAVLKRWKHTRTNRVTGKKIVALSKKAPKPRAYVPEEILLTDGTWRAVSRPSRRDTE